MKEEKIRVAKSTVKELIEAERRYLEADSAYSNAQTNKRALKKVRLSYSVDVIECSYKLEVEINKKLPFSFLNYVAEEVLNSCENPYASFCQLLEVFDIKVAE